MALFQHHFLLWAGLNRDADVGIQQALCYGFCVELTTMGRNCVVFGCTNTQEKGVWLFQMLLGRLGLGTRDKWKVLIFIKALDWCYPYSLVQRQLQ